MTRQVLTINWAGLFNSEPFRAGWEDYRAGRPIDHARHEGADKSIRAQVDALYAMGRSAAAEAGPLAVLPDITPYYSTQMRALVDWCPELQKEFKLSALRHLANPEQKNNVA